MISNKTLSNRKPPLNRCLSCDFTLYTNYVLIFLQQNQCLSMRLKTIDFSIFKRCLCIFFLNMRFV